MPKLLTSIRTGSGAPIFETLSNAELQETIDSFTSVESEQPSLDFITTDSFSNDIMVVEGDNMQFEPEPVIQAGSPSSGEPSETSKPQPNITSYDYYPKTAYPTVQINLRRNYNMTTVGVDLQFTNILNNIVEELRPPRTSTTFTYDFKFSQNRNGTLTGSSGGRY